MTKETIRTKLDHMVGRLFIINQNQERVESWKMDGPDTIVVTTDQDEYSLNLTVASDRLKDFLPIEEDLDIPISQTPQISVTRNDLTELKNIMLDNIQRIKGDAGYIAQAQEVSKSVGTIIDLAKTEIEYHKLIQRVNQ